MSRNVVTDRGGEQILAGFDVGGVISPSIGGNVRGETVRSIFDSLPDYKYREDDIMLCTYQKTGTNWLYEILSMINNRSADKVKTTKITTMMESVIAEKLDEVSSPRVLNSHFSVRLLPKDLRITKPKTVLCVRNPKDTAVSFFNHTRARKDGNYNGQFPNWLPVYLEGKRIHDITEFIPVYSLDILTHMPVEYGKYTDYLKDWEQAINDGIDFPLHLMYYEDLKMYGPQELDRLLKFLEVDLDETLKSDILEACSFENMAQNKFPKEMAEKIFKTGFNFFRKGQIGDWKNWFTVAENEMFDSIWESEMKDSKLFKFIYADPRVNVGN